MTSVSRDASVPAMPRSAMFALFYLAVFLQAGAYGLTFMLPRLFAGFGADERVVGAMLLLTTISTLITVYGSGHLSDWFGRMRCLGGACISIALALACYGLAQGVGVVLILASLALGAGWALTYSLAPIAVTRLVAPEDRVRYFAILSVAVMAGFGLSPVMAAMMERAGFTIRDAFFVTAALCALAGVIFFALTSAVRHHALATGVAERSRLTPDSVMRILRTPARLPVIMVCIGASVFAGMNNFQTVFADARGLDYAGYFLTYTITVVLFRVALARFKGGKSPWLTIAALQYVMCGSVALFMISGSDPLLYLLVAVLFGIGYGVSYPILAAMAANEAEEDLLPQTLQLFALTYFIGIFGFPLVAGWLIVAMGSWMLLALVTVLAGIEASMALVRALRT